MVKFLWMSLIICSCCLNFCSCWLKFCSCWLNFCSCWFVLAVGKISVAVLFICLWHFCCHCMDFCGHCSNFSGCCLDFCDLKLCSYSRQHHRNSSSWIGQLGGTGELEQSSITKRSWTSMSLSVAPVNGHLGDERCVALDFIFLPSS